MKIIETERLFIEEATTDDTSFFFTLLNSETWIEYIGDRHIKTPEDATNYINHNLIKSYRDNGFGFYKMVLKSTREPIGICGFAKRSYLSKPDIGFAILPQFEKQGYTYEAAKSMIQYGFQVLHLRPVLAITSEKNIKSQRLLCKLGMKKIGTIKPDDKEKEVLVYSTIE